MILKLFNLNLTYYNSRVERCRSKHVAKDSKIEFAKKNVVENIFRKIFEVIFSIFWNFFLEYVKKFFILG